MNAANTVTRAQPARVLESALMEVFEESAFLLTAPAQRIAGWRIEDPMHAVLRFEGTELGWLRLSLPRVLLEALNVDGLVLPGAADARRTCDAILCSLVQRVAERFLPAYFGAEWLGECAYPSVRVAAPRPPRQALYCRAVLVTEGAHPLESEMVVLPGAAFGNG